MEGVAAALEDAVGVEAPVAEAVGDGVGEALLTVAEAEAVMLEVGEVPTDAVTDAVTVVVGVPLVVPVGATEMLPVTDEDGLLVASEETEGLAVLVGLAVGSCVPLDLLLTDAVAV